MIYSSKIFECKTIDAAKEIILTSHNGLSVAERWEKETPLIVHILRQQFHITDTLIDFGCGIGRIAREMSNPILGIDISLSMRQMAIGYVGRDNFVPASSTLLPVKNKYDGAYAVWSLQHVLEPALEIANICNSLHDGARFVIIGTKQRFVPSDNGWIDDKIDINKTLESYFSLVYEYSFAEDLVGKDCATVQIWRKE